MLRASTSRENKSKTVIPRLAAIHDDDDDDRKVVSPFRLHRKLLLTLLAVVTVLGTVTQVNFRQRRQQSLSFSSQKLRASSESHQKCTVWLAPSSLKGHSGYGIFTTRPLAKDEPILGGPDGVSIPIIDAYRSRKFPHNQARKNWVRVWENYWWARGVPDHVRFEAPDDVVDYQIGFGALPNHHCILSYLDTRYPDPAYIDGRLDLTTGSHDWDDPGAGAYSYNRGRSFTVEHSMQPGDEIFLNYGYCKRSQTSFNPSWTSEIYMTQDFETAAKIIWQYATTTHSDNKEGLTYSIEGRAIIPPGTDRLVAELLPATKRDMDTILQGAANVMQVKSAVVQRSLNARTPDWIKNNGMCLENIVPKVSTLPSAGQGAFAQFRMRRGEIVAPAPLLQIVDKNALNLYNQDMEIIGTQLVLNYCFGHQESTLLLCPNSNAVLINHCSTRRKQCGPQGPNAKVQWSSGWDPSSDQWRRMTLEQMAAEAGRGLAFEIVATRDIAAGEEIFIDYGPIWEKAWDDHVQTWKPPARPAGFVSAKEANENDGPVLEELVSGDLRKEVNHPYLFTGCVYYESRDDRHEYYKQEGVDWKSRSDKEILEWYADDASGGWYSYKYPEEGYKHHSDYTHWPCSVLREQKDGRYVVRIHQNPYFSGQPWHENNLPRLLVNYPRSAIHYFVQPRASDQQLANAFRQWIQIPEDMFPSQWKNLPKPYDSS